MTSTAAIIDAAVKLARPHTAGGTATWRAESSTENHQRHGAGRRFFTDLPIRDRRSMAFTTADRAAAELGHNDIC